MPARAGSVRGQSGEGIWKWGSPVARLRGGVEVDDCDRGGDSWRLSRESCDPVDVADWSASNPAWGQCAVPSLVVQDLFEWIT